jgi:hypothetical protein
MVVTEMDLSTIGRTILLTGLALAAVGALLAFGGSLPLLGRLPGDIRLGGERWAVYIPIGTSILLSVVLTLALGAAGWLGRR